MKNLRLLYSLFLFLSFHSAHSADYYWVGGSGNWTDVSNHWSKSSGILDPHATVPGFNDNVIFDANSFTAPGQTLTLDNSATCKNMIWTGVTNNPTWMSTVFQAMNIYGSLTLDPAMAITFYGRISFYATTPGHTITTAGQPIPSLSFKGVGGEWTLQDDLTLDSGDNIDLMEGSLFTNNFNIKANSFYSAGNPQVLDLGTSIIEINKDFELDPSGLIFNSGTSTIRLNGTFDYPRFEASGFNFNNIEFLNPSDYADIRAYSCNIKSLTIACGASMLGSSTYETINLAAGMKYKIEDGQTQNITNLNAIGNCSSGYIELSSFNAGQQTTFNIPSGNISLDRVILRDIQATGPGTFTANNCVDMGNNSGWIINAATPATLYWVGGKGNWSDSQHWSFSSGGAGGACVPTTVDNVRFDANSFSAAGDTVTIDIHANCYDMDWTGVANNPVLSGTYKVSSLNIYGSLAFSPSMSIAMPNRTFLQSLTTGQTITMAGQSFPDEVYFEGIGGGWTFNDAFSAESIYLENGSVNTNNQILTCKYFHSQNSNVRSLSLGSSLFNITGSWRSKGTNFSLNAGSSLINLTGSGSYINNTTTGLTFYDVTFTGISCSLSNPSGSFHNVSFAGDGGLNTDMTFNTLSFNPGARCLINKSSTQTINTFIISGTCSKHTQILGNSVGTQATIDITSGNVISDYLILQDIHITGPGSFIANNSVDLGNNSGWIINTAASRSLYWIGGSGNWSDSSHWALSSGSLGGACVPTANDDVFFDANSFSAVGDTVTIDVELWCRDMDWTGSLFNPTFAGSNVLRINIYGSLTFINAMNADYDLQTYFHSASPGNTIATGGQIFRRNVNFFGNGSWTLIDDFKCDATIGHYNGTLNTNNVKVECRDFISVSSNVRTLLLGSSQIIVNYELSINDNALTLNAGTSLIKMTGLSGNSWLDYTATTTSLYDVDFLFSGTSKINGPGKFHNVHFYNSGSILKNNYFNKLILSSGKTYSLESGKTQTIDTLDAKGNPCQRITIKAGIAGNQSIISKASGTVQCDYLELIDQKATGGAIFNAGAFSWDVSNNTGWLFGNSDFGLGPDTAIQTCGASITLSTANFNGTDSTTYVWSDSSTTDSLVVSSSGTYWVTARYDSSCLYTDSINVSIDPALINLVTSPDTTVCIGNSTTLTASGGNTYAWSPAAGLSNTTGSSVIASPGTTTTYSVWAENGICNDTKLITVTVVPPPTLTVTSQATICPGGTVTLTAAGAANYTWSPSAGLSSTTGSSVDASVTATTVYQVQGEIGGCTSAVYTVTVSLPSSLIANITGASEVCMGSAITLSASVSGGGGTYNYSWLPGGSNGSTITVSPTTQTTYTMQVTDNCLETADDQITVNINPLPVVSFNSDITEGCGPLCINFNNTTPNANTLQWSFGDGNTSINSSPQHCYTNDGLYSVSLIITDTKGCSDVLVKNNMIRVYASPTAQFFADPMQTTIANPTIQFTDQSQGAISWLWNFGDNTQATEQHTSHTYDETGTYTVKLFVTNTLGCSDSLEKEIIISPNTYIFYVPNAISPNNDGQNDVFSPQTTIPTLSNYKLLVYDRWGKLVFESVNINQGWNASVNNTNELVNTGTYAWEISFDDHQGAHRIYKGNLNVIR